MARRVKLSTIKNILKDLDEKYVTVKIPRISLDIITKHYIEDIDPTTVKQKKKMTIREFLGYEDVTSGTAKLNYTNQGYVKGFEYEEQASIDYLNGEPIKKSVMKLREAYIPISFLIHIYNNGYSIKVPKLETLVFIIEKIEEVLDKVGDLLIDKDPEILEFIEDFYNAIIDGREDEINSLLENREIKRLKKNKSILAYMDKTQDKTIGTIDMIRTRSGKIDTLDLSELVVK